MKARVTVARKRRMGGEASMRECDSGTVGTLRREELSHSERASVRVVRRRR